MTIRKICLAISTTSTHLGLALHDMAVPALPCLARYFAPAPGRQAELLFPKLDALLKGKRLKRADLALVAVDHGPGSFTGVRVGVAAARGIAQSLRLPVVGVGALEALARDAAFRGPVTGIIASRIPSVAGEAFFAVYRMSPAGTWSVLRAPVWTTDTIVNSELARLARKGAHLAYLHRAGESLAFPAGLRLHPAAAPDPSALARIAVERAGRRPAERKFSLEAVVPIYLQPSWAERSRKAAARRTA